MADSGVESESSDPSLYSYLEKSIQGFVQSHRDKHGSCKRLGKAFPEMQQKHPEALTLISDTVGERYTKNTLSSINELMETAEMKDKLDQLEMLEGNNDEWRPSGDPEKDLRAHITLTKQREIQDLEKQLQAEEEELKTLRETVAEKNKAIQQKLLHVSALAEDAFAGSRVSLSYSEKLHDIIAIAKLQ